MFENNVYTYTRLDDLFITDTDVNDYLVEHNFNVNINIICFNINNKGKYPFFQFMLHNYLSGVPFIGQMQNKFSFPSMGCKDCTSDDLYSNLITHVSDNLLKTYHNIQLDPSKIELKGYYENNNELYAFVDVSKISVEPCLLYKNTEYWFVLLTEITNNQSVCDMKINKEVINFFITHCSYFFLENPEEHTLYPHPDVIYDGSHLKKADFQNVFGISKKDDIYGKQYYLTASLDNAFRNGGWNNTFSPEYKYDKLITDNEFGRYIQGGINRIAILSDKIIYKTIPIVDVNDDQPINEFVDSLFTLYDTIYIEDLDKQPTILIKEYSQQIPLSYHKINKFSLQESWNEGKEYSII